MVHTSEYCALADFEPVDVEDGEDCAGLFWVNVLDRMPRSLLGTKVSIRSQIEKYVWTYPAVGPVSASPSPTTQVTIRSGLSMTAPNDTASAYPSSPPSWIAPGVSALIWLKRKMSTLCA